jgi:polysaccharide lyase family 8, super-sandwich domain protein
MVLIQPSASDLDELRKTPAYEVLQRDQTAHVVYDKKTGITAYAAFEAYQPAADKVFVAIPAETMVMYAKESDKGIRLSVCDPNLNIEEKTYTTKEPSRPITKEIRLKGHWRLTSPMENVRLEQQGDQTVLTVTCQHGQPVEMLMENK